MKMRQHYILLKLDQNKIKSEFGGFYFSDVNTSIPDDAIPISKTQWQEYYNQMAINGFLLWADKFDKIKTRNKLSKWDNVKAEFVDDKEQIIKASQQILVMQAQQEFEKSNLSRYHFDKLAPAQQKKLNSYLAALEDIITGEHTANDKLPEKPDFLK